MNMRLLAAAALSFSALTLGACSDDDDDLDDAIEEAGDELEETGDDVEDEIDDEI